MQSRHSEIGKLLSPGGGRKQSKANALGGLLPPEATKRKRTMRDRNPSKEILDLIEADFDFHQYPTQFTLAQLIAADQWLKEAALAVLASGGFHPSGSELATSPDAQQDV